LQLSIPLFEGFARTYQVKQANAHTELQLDLLAEVRQRLGLEVWSGYQSVNGATANLGHSATLLRLAQRAYDAALRRYESGVGGILELLNSQAALARAKQQKVQALTDWRVARLELAAALGKLGVSHLDDEHLSSNVGIEATISAIADLSAKTPSTPDERLRATAAR
jgi:outer membrane protein